MRWALLEKRIKEIRRRELEMRFDYEILDLNSWEHKALLRSRKIRTQLFIYDLIIYEKQQPNCIILSKR